MCIIFLVGFYIMWTFEIKTQYNHLPLVFDRKSKILGNNNLLFEDEYNSRHGNSVRCCGLYYLERVISSCANGVSMFGRLS